MLKHRIIPTLLSRNGSLVKGRGFNSTRVVGHVLQAARIHQARGVDELLIYDVAAREEARGPDYALIEQITADCFMPITVGGGVFLEEHVKGLLRAGADKVSISWQAIGTGVGLRLIEACARKFGSQAISVTIDHQYDGACAWQGRVYRKDGLVYHTGSSANAAARAAQDAGAGEIIFQNAWRDGTMSGYDFSEMPKDFTILEGLKVPAVISGGCSGIDDMEKAIKAGASAVAAGALFQFTSTTPGEAARRLQARGIPTRVEA